MQMIKNCKIFLGVILCLSVFSASIVAHKHEWEPITPGPFNTWTAPLCGKKCITMQSLFFFNNINGSFNDNREFTQLDDRIKKTQLNSQLFIQYGLFEHFEIDVQLSFINSSFKQVDSDINAFGFGDMLLIGRHCPFEETLYIPHITGLFQVKLPTGKYKDGDDNKMGLDLSGTGSTDFTFGVNLSKKLKPFILHSDLLYTIPTEINIDGNKIQYGTSINFNLAGEVILPHGFNIMIEFNDFSQNDRKENNSILSNSGVESRLLGLGIGWSREKLQLLFGYQKTIYGKNTDSTEGIAFTAVFPIF